MQLKGVERRLLDLEARMPPTSSGPPCEPERRADLIRIALDWLPPEHRETGRAIFAALPETAGAVEIIFAIPRSPLLPADLRGQFILELARVRGLI